MTAELAIAGDFPPVQSTYVYPYPGSRDWWKQPVAPVHETFVTTWTVQPPKDKSKELAMIVIRDALDRVRDALTDDERRLVDLALEVMMQP